MRRGSAEPTNGTPSAAVLKIELQVARDQHLTDFIHRDERSSAALTRVGRPGHSDHVFFEPCSELLARQRARRHRNDCSFLFFDGSANLKAIQHERNFERGVADRLLPSING